MSTKFLAFDPRALQDSSLGRQPGLENELVRDLSAIARDRLLDISGVVGYGFVGDDELVVYVDLDKAISQLPKMIEGLKVRVERTGTIKSLLSLP